LRVKGDVKGDVALQVLFPDEGGPGVQGGSGTDGRAAFPKMWAGVSPKAGPSELSGCGEADGTIRGRNSTCNATPLSRGAVLFGVAQSGERTNRAASRVTALGAVRSERGARIIRKQRPGFPSRIPDGFRIPDAVVAVGDNPDQEASSVFGLPLPSARRPTPCAAGMSAPGRSKPQRYKKATRYRRGVAEHPAGDGGWTIREIKLIEQRLTSAQRFVSKTPPQVPARN